MKIVFAGTPEFAVPTLRRLIESRHQVIAVYTQPDRPAGRGQQVQLSPIKQLALEQEIPVYQPLSLKDPQIQAEFAALKPDLMIVVAYGLILPKAILDLPAWGCINVHASLLPRWRGAAPIQKAILAGDPETGVTIMQIEPGLDSGPMLKKLTTPIHPTDTSQSLHDRLAALGAETLLETLDEVEAGRIQPEIQDHSLATHAGKIQKSDAKIHWALPAIELDRLIRAYNPWPVAYFDWNQQACRVFKAIPMLGPSHQASPGTILSVDQNGIEVATGLGSLRLEQLQLPGGKVLTVQELLRGRAGLFQPGIVLQ